MSSNRGTTKVLALAAALLLVAGAVHRWAHHSRADLSARVRPPAQPLSEIPGVIGKYVSTGDVPMGQAVLQVADVDSYLYRRYEASGVNQPSLLYVGYWGRQNTGMGHGPEICYPAVGWTAEDEVSERRIQFQEPDGTSANAVIGLHRFSREDPSGTTRLAVGFVAMVDGRFRASSRGVFFHRPARSRHTGALAHIHVATPSSDASWAGAEDRIVAFMENLLPHVYTCLLGSPEDSESSSAHAETG